MIYAKLIIDNVWALCMQYILAFRYRMKSTVQIWQKILLDSPQVLTRVIQNQVMKFYIYDSLIPDDNLYMHLDKPCLFKFKVSFKLKIIAWKEMTKSVKKNPATSFRCCYLLLLSISVLLLCFMLFGFLHWWVRWEIWFPI